jgi:hypothetical protein
MSFELLQVGTDTEVFLTSRVTKTPVPAVGLIGGTKHKPKPVATLGKGYAVQEDNVMLEYNVPPAGTKESFVSQLTTMRGYLDSLTAELGLDIAIAPSMLFTKEQLSSRQAQELGCEPDFCVWTRTANPSPKETGSALLQTMRTAGGHIHVSFNKNDKPASKLSVFDKEPIVKALDLTLGLPSLFIDVDTRRKELYGKGGAFRDKDYGIEYRVLSNFWTASSELMSWAYDGVVTAFKVANTPNAVFLLEDYGASIKGAIDAGNTKIAWEMLHCFGLVYRTLDKTLMKKKCDSPAYFGTGAFA